MSQLEEAIALIMQRGRRIEFYEQKFSDGGSMYYVKLWRDRRTQDEQRDLKVCSLPGSLAESILKAESCFKEADND